MGLDQSAYALKKIEEFPDFADDDTLFIPCEFDSWGKFWSLYHWMKNLYHEKGGTAEVFNCIYLRLTTQDLERLSTVTATTTIFIKIAPTTELLKKKEFWNLDT